MNTSISVPDEVFDAADALAARLGVSRSELYARAVEEFVARHRDQDVTSQLNAVYANEPSVVTPSLRRAQARSIGRQES